MLRRRFWLFIAVTGLILLGVLLIYWQRTGTLTIFGDEPVTPASLEVSNPVDLAKGVTAGDGGTELVDGVLQLRNLALISVLTGPRYPKSATAVFDIGEPEVLTLYRIRLLGEPSLPEGTSVSLDVAGSLDGVSFGPLVSAGPLASDTATPIDLKSLIPEGSHFVRLAWTLSTEDPALTPAIPGFAVDYDTAGDQAAILINRTSPGAADRTVQAQTPRFLAATGASGGVVLGFAILFATLMTFWLQSRSTRRR